jgi:nicotinamidase-related amidase
MQRIFAPDGPWPTPWLPRVLPVVEELAERFAARTVFTRFITPVRAEDMPGTWQRYYAKWRDTTRDRIDPALLDLFPSLRRLAPPAVIIDKMRYSAFAGSQLLEHLMQREADGVVVTGAETDVCVLSTILDTVDLGYRVVLVQDAVCSSSDEGHNALLKLYRGRFSEQIVNASAQDVLARWK